MSVKSEFLRHVLCVISIESQLCILFSNHLVQMYSFVVHNHTQQVSAAKRDIDICFDVKTNENDYFHDATLQNAVMRNHALRLNTH